jgi:hypothetical protein
VAYGTTTQWPSRVVIQEAFEAGFVSTVFRNNHFLPLFNMKESLGDTDLRWKVNSVGNTNVTTYNEGDPELTAVAQTWVNANLPYVYFRGTIRQTGHVRDALKNQGVFAGLQAMTEDVNLTAEDIRDVMNTTFQGTGASGIQLAVDSTGTYAGLNRATETHWASYENAVGGAITVAEIATMRENLRDGDRGELMDTLLVRNNQVRRIQALIGEPGAANNSYRSDLTAASGRLQLLPLFSDTKVGEADVVGVPDLTNTIALGLSRRWFWTVVHRPFEVEMDRVADDKTAALTTAAVFQCKRPDLQGKLTGLTA